MKNVSFDFKSDLFLILVLFTFFACANTQNDTNTNAEKQCGDTRKMVDECFKDLPSHLMEFLQTTKIAINEKEIASKCTVFHRGMECFDDYTARCLANKRTLLVQNNVEGAKKFFTKFCNDRDFQRDYLRHKDCFSHIQKDWISCTEKFQDILLEKIHVEDTNITNKFMEFCCARHAHENCIFTAARFKCYEHSAKFARDTVKMLSDEVHFKNCHQYEDVLCDAGSFNSNKGRTLMLMLGLLVSIIQFLLQFRS